MKQHPKEESSLEARREFALHWIQQRTGEWLESFHAEDKYRQWLLQMIEESGYTLPELELLRKSMRFILALDYIASGVGFIRRKTQSILNRSSYDRDDHLEQEIIERNRRRHSHLLLSFLTEAITKEKAAHPSRKIIH